MIDKEKHDDKEESEPEHKEGEEEGENGQAEAEGNGEESDGDKTDHNLEEGHEKSGNMSLFNNGHTGEGPSPIYQFYIFLRIADGIPCKFGSQIYLRYISAGIMCYNFFCVILEF